MGLTAWDLGTDPYDHSQLAANFSAVDMHDHTPGKGLQIPAGGIANNAITSSKIAANQVLPGTHIPADSITQASLAVDSVGNSELADNSVGAANIINGSVTAAKLDPNIRPVGEVVMWYRATSSILPPAGWEVMDGRAWSTIPNALGPGGVQWNTGNIPNMFNKFALGAALGGTGAAPSQPPDVGQVGGLHERDLSHTHANDPHSHTVASHTHGLIADGNHTHQFICVGPPGYGTFLSRLYSRDVGVPQRQGTRQALFGPAHNWGGFLGSEVPLDMETTGNHNHTGLTTGATPGTSSGSIAITTAGSATQDFRPAHVGLIFIMKVL